MSVSNAIVPYQNRWDVILPPIKHKKVAVPKILTGKCEEEHNRRPLRGRARLLTAAIFGSLIKEVVGGENSTTTSGQKILIASFMGGLGGFVFVLFVITLCCINCRKDPIEHDIENQHLIQNE